jgi:hypothetical protein
VVEDERLCDKDLSTAGKPLVGPPAPARERAHPDGYHPAQRPRCDRHRGAGPTDSVHFCSDQQRQRPRSVPTIDSPAGSGQQHRRRREGDTAPPAWQFGSRGDQARRLDTTGVQRRRRLVTARSGGSGKAAPLGSRPRPLTRSAAPAYGRVLGRRRRCGLKGACASAHSSRPTSAPEPSLS